MVSQAPSAAAEPCPAISNAIASTKPSGSSDAKSITSRSARSLGSKRGFCPTRCSPHAANPRPYPRGRLRPFLRNSATLRSLSVVPTRVPSSRCYLVVAFHSQAVTPLPVHWALHGRVGVEAARARWFAELTNRKLRRSAHRSVTKLEAELRPPRAGIVPRSHSPFSLSCRALSAAEECVLT